MTSPEVYQYESKIPKERIAVLIGVKGKVKRDIEVATRTKLKIDSEEGEEDAVIRWCVASILRKTIFFHKN